MSDKKSPRVKHDDPTMAGQRARNITRELRRMRADTLVATIEDTYGVNFGVRSDVKLETLREKFGEDEIAELVQKSRTGQ